MIVIDQNLTRDAGLRLAIDAMSYVAIVLVSRAVDLRELRALVRAARNIRGEPTQRPRKPRRAPMTTTIRGCMSALKGSLLG